MKKTIILLHGMPCTGKSTHIENLKNKEDFYIISRDNVRNEVVTNKWFLKNIGVDTTLPFKYSYTFIEVKKDINIEEYNKNPNKQFGKIIFEEKEAFWEATDKNGNYPKHKIYYYEYIKLINEEIKKRFDKLTKKAMLQEKNIIIDMMNSTPFERKEILNKIGANSENSNLYGANFKIKLKDSLELNKLRGELLDDKIIPSDILEIMYNNMIPITNQELREHNKDYQNSASEKIVNVDVIKNDLLNKIKEKNKLKNNENLNFDLN